MSDKAAIVFTAKSIERILKEGGTSSWRLDRNHARQCPYSVCTRNAHADWTEGPEPHHTAFLVGKVKDVVPCPKRPDRFLIQFSEFARVDFPNSWHGGRNPVSYGTLKELGIDPSTLKWEPMPELTEPATAALAGAPKNGPIGALTMIEAKNGLALTFGVSPASIEITIRG
jgi:hypothetical protein